MPKRTLIFKNGSVNLIFQKDTGSDPDPGTLEAIHHFTPGWATFGQPIPEGAVPAGQAVQVGSLDTQFDIKNRYPDGSVKFAVVTCNPTETGDQTLSVVADDPGDFTPTIPTASVTFAIGEPFVPLGSFAITGTTATVEFAGLNTEGYFSYIGAFRLKNVASPFDEHIVGTLDGGYTETSGTWSSYAAGYGGRTRYSFTTGRRATFAFSGLTAGATYELSITYRQGPFPEQSVLWGLLDSDGTTRLNPHATVRGGTSTTIQLAADHSENPSGHWVYLLSGTGAGQTRKIWSYDGTTKTATLETTWATTPDTSSVYTFSMIDQASTYLLGATAIRNVTEWTAALPETVSDDLWLDGEQVKEWRSIVTPVDDSFNAHPSIRVYFDTHVYSDGQARIDVTVENLLNIAGAATAVYDVEIVVAGESVFSQELFSHTYMTRWSKVFGVGLTESDVTLDWEPAFASHALPRFRDSVSNQSYSTEGASFAIGKTGALNPYMPSTGGRPEIGPYPDWTARSIVHKTADQREYVLANGRLGGSWPIHIRESDGSLVNIDDRPEFWLDTSNRGQDKPAGDTTGCFLINNPDLAHVPSIAYVPYLMTGDRFFCDEMIFWGNHGLLGVWPNSDEAPTRNGSEGLLRSEQVRGQAWALRNLTDAASFAPDDHPLKSYLAEKVINNLNYYDSFAVSGNTPLGVAWISTRPTSPTVSIALWEYTYLSWSLDHSNRQGFTGGLDYRDSVVAFTLSLFTSPDWFPGTTAPGVYTISIGTPDGLGGIETYFENLAEVAENTFTPGNPIIPFSGFYGQNERLMLMIAIESSLYGAQDAYDFLMPYIVDVDLVASAGWSIESL